MAADSAPAGSATGVAATAGWSRAGGLRSTTMSAKTAASSPTAPITREIVLLMAHPNPARRPWHQGVVPGINPGARGHARHPPAAVWRPEHARLGVARSGQLDPAGRA